ncbi:outer membrane beta-barrel protein [Hymenobacter terrenus]|uniref:outer membrane beta-barrel protein n=1 Tax=Hymenobacter terrenus TaxID=1629124 RepID=UPI000619FC2F|nr:outer membrane beta-barrel protein [Hymenobacter terrenus]
MSLPKFAVFGLLLGAPLASIAQTPDPAPLPRFYIGLAAYNSYYQQLGKNAYRGSGSRVPVQLTAGYQWRPRLAVQLGVAYSGVSSEHLLARYNYSSTGAQPTYYQIDGKATERNTSFSLLGRYTLTRKLNHRLQFDLLGGFTLEHRIYRTRGIAIDSAQNNQVNTPYDYRTSFNTALVTAGPSVRYRFGEHFELQYDLTFNTRLNSGNYYHEGITTSNSLGLRYRFGRR